MVFVAVQGSDNPTVTVTYDDDDGKIVQLEGILRVAPDNDSLLAQLSQAYVAYAYGWVEADVEALEFEGNYEEADVQRGRARMMYLRAVDLTRHWVRLHNEEVDIAPRIARDGRGRLGAVGQPGGIAEVQDRLARQSLSEGVDHGQAAIDDQRLLAHGMVV